MQSRVARRLHTRANLFSDIDLSQKWSIAVYRSLFSDDMVGSFVSAVQFLMRFAGGRSDMRVFWDPSARPPRRWLC